MPTSDLTLDKNNQQIFVDAMRGAMWLKFDGQNGPKMPEHIQVIPRESLLASFNQRPMYFVGSMKKAMEMQYPQLAGTGADSVHEIPEAVMSFYADLTERQQIYEQEHASIRGEVESSGSPSEKGWGDPGVGE